MSMYKYIFKREDGSQKGDKVLLSMHLALLSIGVVFLVLQSFVWNLSFLFLGTVSCLAACAAFLMQPYFFM